MISHFLLSDFTAGFLAASLNGWVDAKWPDWEWWKRWGVAMAIFIGAAIAIRAVGKIVEALGG